jgi:endonuclease-3
VCPVADLCPSYGEGPTDTAQAAALLKYEFAPGREELLELFLAGRSRAQLQADGWPLSS